MTIHSQTTFPEAWTASKTALTSASPVISIAEAEKLMRRHYGVSGKATRLRGERDDNFRIDGSDGSHLVLKVAHADEASLITNLQTSLLLYLAANTPALLVPRIVATMDGCHELPLTQVEHAGRTARVTSYLYGRPMQSVPTSKSLRYDVGATLARLARGLRDFTHPAADRILIWDLHWAPQLRELMPALPDQQTRRSLLRHIDHFESHVWPQVARLRAQVIHNDFNGDNVIIDQSRDVVSGILDFGDAVHAPRIVDVAVAAAYHLTDDANPIAAATDLVVGYHELEPLTTEELALIYDLILMRLLFRIVITEWRASLLPADRSYIRRNSLDTWAHFSRLEATPRDVVFVELMRRCGLS